MAPNSLLWCVHGWFSTFIHLSLCLHVSFLLSFILGSFLLLTFPFCPCASCLINSLALFLITLTYSLSWEILLPFCTLIINGKDGVVSCQGFTLKTPLLASRTRQSRTHQSSSLCLQEETGDGLWLDRPVCLLSVNDMQMHKHHWWDFNEFQYFWVVLSARARKQVLLPHSNIPIPTNMSYEYKSSTIEQWLTLHLYFMSSTCRHLWMVFIRAEQTAH